MKECTYLGILFFKRMQFMYNYVCINIVLEFQLTVFCFFFHFIYVYLFVCISRFLTVLVYIKDTGRNVSISVHQVIIFFFFCLSTFVYIHLLVHSNSVIFKSIGICHTGVNYNIFIHATMSIELDIKILINISTRVQYFASKY